MGGHVNMMDDVLIVNLTPELLRSSLRAMLALGRDNQQAFVKHVRGRLAALDEETPLPEELFPAPDCVSDACLQYMARTRCYFSSKMLVSALTRLTTLCNAIVASKAEWSPGSPLAANLDHCSGDIIQSVQALKESGLAPDDELQGILSGLAQSLVACRRYCHDVRPSPLNYPFLRAERQVRDVHAILFPSSTALNGVAASDSVIEIKAINDSAIEKVDYGELQLPRLFNGLWQLSSPAWGSASAESQELALKALVEAGLTATDMADHYGDAELVYGGFRNRLPAEMQPKVHAATKWCVFKPVTEPITEAWVLQNVEARSRRLGGRVDLLQFHWYNWNEESWLFILECLVRLCKTRPDLVRTIGLCNFSSGRTAQACEHLLNKLGYVGIVSNQVQFSLIDSRPLHELCAVCEKYGLKLLTYGSLSGGLLSEKWLKAPAPEVYSESTKLTPSQRKYYDMITNWGTWTEFQELLARLAKIASRYSVSVTVIASRWILQQPAVGSLIVGTRLGLSAHGNENLKVFDFTLTKDDLAYINEAALGVDSEKVASLYNRVGDSGDEYQPTS